MTPDTLLMIGSVTKPMTSTLAATLVDDGRLRWDTPLVELLPGFATADPALTAKPGFSIGGTNRCQARRGGVFGTSPIAPLAPSLRPLTQPASPGSLWRRTAAG